MSMLTSSLFCLLCSFLSSESFKLSTPFATLDERIVESLSSLNVDNESFLLYNLITYYNQLEHVYDLIKDKQTEGQTLLATIDKQGPRFISIPFDLKLITETYKWNQDQINELMGSIHGCRYIWKEIMELNTQNFTVND